MIASAARPQNAFTKQSIPSFLPGRNISDIVGFDDPRLLDRPVTSVPKPARFDAPAVLAWNQHPLDVSPVGLGPSVAELTIGKPPRAPLA